MASPRARLASRVARSITTRTGWEIARRRRRGRAAGIKRAAPLDDDPRMDWDRSRKLRRALIGPRRPRIGVWVALAA
jgi:hypothetical protein